MQALSLMKPSTHPSHPNHGGGGLTATAIYDACEAVKFTRVPRGTPQNVLAARG